MTTPTSKYTFTLGAGQMWRQPIVGRFFRILACTGPVRLQTANVSLDQCIVGDGMEKTAFDWLAVTDQSGGSNTVTIVISDEAFLNAPQTNTAITSMVSPKSGGFLNTQKTVTNASGALVAASPGRQYLLIQNKDSQGNIFVTFGGAAATQANGLKISPGGYWEWSEVIPTGGINAIGDIANNPNVVIVEG